MPIGKANISTEALRRKLALLLSWGSTHYHVQPHRPYLAVAVIKHIHNLVLTRKAPDDRWIEPFLMSWVDQAAESADEETALAMQVLSSELFNSSMLQFDAYLQRMIALGRTARQSSGLNSVDKYLGFCKRLQIFDLPQVLVTLRKNITVGFETDIQVSSHDREIQEALNQYLDQSNGIRYSYNLFERTLAEIPAILLNMNNSCLIEHCQRRLSEFSVATSSPSLDLAVRLSLLIHLLERQQNYRLLLDLLAMQWRAFGNSITKPVADAIKRHRLIVSSFEEQHPDLRAALSGYSKASIFASGDGPAIAARPDIVLQQIQDLQQHVSMIDYQTLEKLHLAHCTRLTADSVPTLWTISLEMVSRLDVQAKPRVISVIADLWTTIIEFSRKAWKSHLHRWVVDSNPTSPIYAATSALFLELLLRGAIGSSLVWSKLVHPFTSSPAQANLNRFYLQPMALLCVCLLPIDPQPVGTAHELLLDSAITADFAGLVLDESGASSILRRLPSVLLMMLDETSPIGISRRIHSIVNSQYVQSFAVRYEAYIKDSFSSAMAEVPERRLFLQSLLDALLGKSWDGKFPSYSREVPSADCARDHLSLADVATCMTSTDWRTLGAFNICSGDVPAPEASGVYLTLPQASSIVTAASELLLNGSVSTWWRMCTTLPDHALRMVSIDINLRALDIY